MIELQKKAKGERPRYFADPAVEKLMSILLALVGETAVLRDRLDSVARLLAKGEAVTPEALDTFVPDADVRAAREEWRKTYFDVIFRAVHQEREELESKAAVQAYDRAIEAVNIE
jgi:hypothetical protein